MFQNGARPSTVMQNFKYVFFLNTLSKQVILHFYVPLPDTIFKDSVLFFYCIWFSILHNIICEKSSVVDLRCSLDPGSMIRDPRSGKNLFRIPTGSGCSGQKALVPDLDQQHGKYLNTRNRLSVVKSLPIKLLDLVKRTFNNPTFT